MSSSQNRHKRSGYHSFMVRLWQDELQMPWRASAQSVQTGETICFADLENLFAFLQAQTEPSSQQGSGKTIENRSAHQDSDLST
jgi:hypothetical protein